jgi:quinol monooxygenase YgiN
MESVRAVATFPYIAPDNLEAFKKLASEMLLVIHKQESILRYDLFFSADLTQCVALEEFTSPAGILEHVAANRKILDQLAELGGQVTGAIFPMSQEGEALEVIRSEWRAPMHIHFAGK